MEDFKITAQKCSIDGVKLLACPWKPAPADCWDASTTSVTAVMRRKLLDHYDLEEDIFKKGEEGLGNYLFKGGYSIM